MEIIIIGLLFLIAVVSYLGYLVVFGDKKKEGRKAVRLK